MKRPKHKAAYLIGLFLILLTVFSLTALFYLYQNTSGQQSLTAEIYQDGKLIDSIPLDQVTESYTFTVTSQNGGSNTIEVRPGEIGVTHADCADKICVNQGFIHDTLLPITCLPNRLVIQLKNTPNKDSLPDAITH